MKIKKWNSAKVGKKTFLPKDGIFTFPSKYASKDITFTCTVQVPTTKK